MLRFALALVPLVWLARRIDPEKLFEQASHVGVWPLVLSFGLYLASVLGSALRWRILIRATGAATAPSLGALFRHYMVGYYFNLLPSGVVGDAMRGHRIRGYLQDATTSYLIVLLERVVGLLAVVTLGAVASLPLPGAPVLPLPVFFQIVLWGGVAGTILLLAATPLIPQTPLWPYVIRLPKVGPALERLAELRAYRALPLTIVISLAVNVLVIASAWAIGGPLHSAITFMACARVFPLVVLAVIVPLTPAGIGQREAVFAYFFGLVGVPIESALALSFVSFGVTLAAAAMGAIIHMRDTPPKDAVENVPTA